MVSDLERKIEQEIVDTEMEEHNKVLFDLVEKSPVLQRLSPGLGKTLVVRAKLGMAIENLRSKCSSRIDQYAVETRAQLEKTYKTRSAPDFDSCLSYDWLHEKSSEAVDAFAKKERAQLEKDIEATLRAFPDPQGAGSAVVMTVVREFKATEPQRQKDHLKSVPKKYSGETFQERRREWRK